MRCDAVRRFEAIARAMRVETVHVLATEATRRATQRRRPDRRRSAAATGLETRVLSGPGGGDLRRARGDLGLLPAEGAGRRHGRRQPRGRRGARRPGGRAHGQHAARRAAGEGDAGGRRRRGEEADRRHPRRVAAAAADRSGLLRDRRRLAGAGARAHRAEPARRSASCTATTSRPTTCGRSPRRSRGWRRRRWRRCPTCRAGASTRCRRRPLVHAPGAEASCSRSGWCSRCSGSARAGSTPSSTPRSGTATRCSRARRRSGCRSPGCRSSAPRWRAGPTSSSPARPRATGGCGSRSAR